MRSPNKYGKRKRSSYSTSEMQWKETVDPEFDLHKITSTGTPHARHMIYGIPGTLPTSARLDMLSKKSTPVKSTRDKATSPPDVFEFEDQSMEISGHGNRHSSPRPLKKDRQQIPKPGKAYAKSAYASVSSPEGGSIRDRSPTSLDNEKSRHLLSRPVVDYSAHTGNPRKGKKRQDPIKLLPPEPNVTTAARPPNSPEAADDQLTKVLELSKREFEQIQRIGEPSKRKDQSRFAHAPVNLAKRSFSGHTTREQKQEVKSHNSDHDLSSDELAAVVCTAEEIDLEPPSRPRTPVNLRARPSTNGPEVSPEQKQVFDLFDTESAARKSTHKPRRLLEALGKTRLQKQLSDLQHGSANNREQELGELIEAAESNLSQNSQQENDSERPLSAFRDSSSKQSDGNSEPIRSPKKVTYSKQRSFLADPEESHSSLNDMLLSGARSPSSQTEEDLEDVDQETTATIANLHDLRQGGESKRFMDEVAYLLDGLNSDQTLQSTLLEIARVLNSNDFARRFRAAGCESRVIKAMRRVDNAISLFATMIIITVVQQGSDTKPLSDECIKILKASLFHSKDVSAYIKDKTIQATKINRSSAQDLRTHVVQTEAFRSLEHDSRISPRTLALMCANMLLENQSDLDFLSGDVLKLLPEYMAMKSNLLAEARLIFALIENFGTKVYKEIDPGCARVMVEVTLSVLYLSTSIDRSLLLCSLLRVLVRLANIQPEVVLRIVERDLISALLRFITSESALGIEESKRIDDEKVLGLGLLICLAEEAAEGPDKIKHIWTRADNDKEKLMARLEEMQTDVRASAVAGYYALLMYHLYRPARSGSEKSRMVSLQENDVAIVRKGLEALRAEAKTEAAADDNQYLLEFQAKLTSHIDDLARFESSI